jgi:hypothetical protein
VLGYKPGSVQPTQKAVSASGTKKARQPQKKKTTKAKSESPVVDLAGDGEEGQPEKENLNAGLCEALLELAEYEVSFAWVRTQN